MSTNSSHSDLGSVTFHSQLPDNKTSMHRLKTKICGGRENIESIKEGQSKGKMFFLFVKELVKTNSRLN